MLFSTPSHFAVLGLVAFGFWLIGFAMHPGGRKWRDLYEQEAADFSAYRTDADDRLRAANRRLAELERDHAALERQREEAAALAVAQAPQPAPEPAAEPVTTVPVLVEPPAAEPVAAEPAIEPVAVAPVTEPAAAASAVAQAPQPAAEPVIAVPVLVEPTAAEPVAAEPAIAPVAEPAVIAAEPVAVAVEPAAEIVETAPAIAATPAEPVADIVAAPVADAPMPIAAPTPTPAFAPEAATVESIAPVPPEQKKAWFGAAGYNDLTQVRGIDGVLSTRLFGLGVTRFADIEKLSAEDEMALEQRLNVPAGFIAREQWREQAALLRAGNTAEHSARFGANALA